MDAIKIGTWVVILNRIIAYFPTGEVNGEQTVDALIASGDIISGRISASHFIALLSRFKILP